VARHSLEHFLREAERCVPHLAPEERRKWAEECHARHPGVTEEHKTGAAPLPDGRGSVGGSRGAVWAAWKAVALALLLFCAAREVRCQDPAGFNPAPDPGFRGVPLLWVINAPSGTCSGVAIQYAFESNPPALWGCNQAGGTWTNLTAGGGGGGGGSGTVTSVATNNGLTGGTITVSGTLGLASIANNGALCNNSGLSAAPTTANCTVTGTGNLVMANSPTLSGTVGGNLTFGGTVTLASTLTMNGSTSGTVTIEPQAAAGTPTLTWPNTSGTFAVNASGPLALNTTTGNLTCGSCLVNSSTNTGTSAMTLNMAASTGSNALQLPSQAGLTCSAGGCVGEDTTATMYHTYTGGADSLVVTVPASTSITNGNCAQWVVSGSVKTLAQASGACGIGGGGSSGTNYYETWLTSGTSWTSPSWVDSNTTVTIYGCGGGGGGGGTNNDGDVGAGGGAGGLFIYTAANAISASTAYTIAIGAAGSGGSAGSAGGSGGATTLTIGSTTYTANGGHGGSANQTLASATGGTASNGTINVTGQSGWGSYGNGGGTGWSFGGNSIFGGGGATVGGGNGSAGGICAGGSGGDGSSGSNQTGGAGGSGLLHIIVSGS
jgi:hypothetical protein